HFRGQGGELPIVRPREKQLRGHRADQSPEHVPLGVPRVALGSEEGVRLRSGQDRRAPFDELVADGNRQAYAGDEEEDPGTRPQRSLPKDDLTRQDRRHRVNEDQPIRERVSGNRRYVATRIGKPRKIGATSRARVNKSCGLIADGARRSARTMRRMTGSVLRSESTPDSGHFNPLTR